MVMVMMRSEGFRWVSSAAAAVYSMAITSVGQDTAASTSPDLDPYALPPTCSCTCGVKVARKEAVEARTAWKVDDRYTPRFDGMRFIETLVTAHR